MASVVFRDTAFVRGKNSFVARLMGHGFLKPQNKLLRTDLAGQVEAVGRNVKQFQPGNEIFGGMSAHGYGGFAEYVSVPENALRLKPASMTFEEAVYVGADVAKSVLDVAVTGSGETWQFFNDDEGVSQAVY